MGDFNARKGKYSDSVCHEGNNIIVNDQSEYSYCPIRRNSYDNELNSHDKRLLDICRSADLKIINGRVSGDTLGRATFHGRNRISVVDYAICDQDTLSIVANFVVKQPWSLSDHSSIITWLNVNTNISELEPSHESNRLSHAYRYNFSGKRIPRQNSKISYAQQIYKPSYENTLMTTLQSRMSTPHSKKLKT